MISMTKILYGFFDLIVNILCSNFYIDLWIANTEMLTEDKRDKYIKSG